MTLAQEGYNIMKGMPSKQLKPIIQLLRAMEEKNSESLGVERGLAHGPGPPPPSGPGPDVSSQPRMGQGTPLPHSHPIFLFQPPNSKSAPAAKEVSLLDLEDCEFG